MRGCKVWCKCVCRTVTQKCQPGQLASQPKIRGRKTHCFRAHCVWNCYHKVFGCFVPGTKRDWGLCKRAEVHRIDVQDMQYPWLLPWIGRCINREDFAHRALVLLLELPYDELIVFSVPILDDKNPSSWKQEGKERSNPKSSNLWVLQNCLNKTI